MSGLLLVLFILIAIILIAVIMMVKIVPQAHVYVVERLGKYYATYTVGVHFILPFIDRVARKISLKEQVVDFEPQTVITKDNVSMMIDTVIYLEITDPKAYCYGSENPYMAIDKLTATTLRNIIGAMELDETLTSRDRINSQMRQILDEATDKWGVRINRVELKNIIPPRDIQDTMEKQMRAERERREAILQAQGEKEAQIARAEGEKQSLIARAEGEKQSRIALAEAEKAASIARAQGEAEAVRLVSQARAEAIQKINDSHPSEAYLRLEGYTALTEIGNSDSSKVIIPAEMGSLASLVTGFSEIAKDSKKQN